MVKFFFRRTVAPFPGTTQTRTKFAWFPTVISKHDCYCLIWLEKYKATYKAHYYHFKGESWYSWRLVSKSVFASILLTGCSYNHGEATSQGLVTRVSQTSEACSDSISVDLIQGQSHSTSFGLRKDEKEKILAMMGKEIRIRYEQASGLFCSTGRIIELEVLSK